MLKVDLFNPLCTLADFAEKITANIKYSYFVSINTDAYGSSLLTR